MYEDDEIKAKAFYFAGRIVAKKGISVDTFLLSGRGIEAGFSIFCKKHLSSGLRIFAGVCTWKIPSDEERMITCQKLIRGEVCYGILKENN